MARPHFLARKLFATVFSHPMAKTRVLFFTLLCTCSQTAISESFPLNEDSDSVVGSIKSAMVRPGESLVDIAREFDLGYDQIILANPGVNRWIPEPETRVILPHLYVLPGSARRGLVLNLAELRLYFYPPKMSGGVREVITHPISIGRMDWRTPLGQTSVIRKEVNPAWYPPQSIRREHEQDGEVLPDFIAGGDPENPLGRFALKLGLPSYLIHGVDERKAYGIGMRVTHGCIRMYPEDIEDLFPQVTTGTPVLIINEPIKLGQRDGIIYLQVHQPLDEIEVEGMAAPPRVQTLEVLHFIEERLGTGVVDAEVIHEITQGGSGIPVEIAQVINGRASPLLRRGDQRPLPAPESSPELSTNDQQYNAAITRYLDTTDQQGPIHHASESPIPPRAQETPRKAFKQRKGSWNDVQKYLQERY